MSFLGQIKVKIYKFIRDLNRIKRFYPKEISNSAVLANRIKKPIIIIGCGRSGTILLFNLLSEHKQLVKTKGFPDGKDTEMWAKIGGAIIAGFGGDKFSNAVGHPFCLSMNENDINEKRINYFHNYLLNRYPKLKKGNYR